MTTYVSCHPSCHGTEQHLAARCHDGGVPGALGIEIESIDGNYGARHDLTIFTNNHEMAKELAAAINAVTAKYSLKLVA